MTAKHERYFLISGGTTRGPFTIDELLNLDDSGVLPAGCQLTPEKGGEPFPFSRILPATLIVPPPADADLTPEQPYTRSVIDSRFPHDAVTTRIGIRQGIAYENIGWVIAAVSLICLAFPAVHFLFPYLFIIAGLFLLTGFYIIWQRMRRIVDTPTSRARSAAIGQAELTGRVIALNNLFGPYSQLPCVICEYQTRSCDPQEGVEIPLFSLPGISGWLGRMGNKAGETGGFLTAPFLLEDDSGTILVDPEGAQLDLTNEYHRWDYEASLAKGIIACERVVAPGEELYIFGRVDLVSGADGSSHRMIHKGEKGAAFYIFRGRENRLLKRMKWKALRNLLGGLCALITALIVLGF